MVRSGFRFVGARTDCSRGWWRSRRGKDPASRGAFTLIELMVVIGIIMILISLLITGLHGAREAGRTAVCLSNQKQISAAMVTYLNSSKDIIPREGTVVVEGRTEIERRSRLPWPVAFRPFLDDRASVNEDINDLFDLAPYYNDPARPRDGHKVHYVVNSMPMAAKGVVDTGARFNYWRRRGPATLGRLLYPSDTLYLTEFSDDANLVVWNQMQSEPQEDLNWTQPYDIWDVLHLQPASSQFRIGSSRHMGSANALYLDGHASTIKKAVLEKVDTWDDRDYGIRNEAPPYARP